MAEPTMLMPEWQCRRMGTDREKESEFPLSQMPALSLSFSIPFFGFSLVASLLGLALACCKFVIDEGEEERDGRGGGFDRGDGVVVAMAAVEERREQGSNR